MSSLFLIPGRRKIISAGLWGSFAKILAGSDFFTQEDEGPEEEEWGKKRRGWKKFRS
jgi:hypothetical protein